MLKKQSKWMKIIFGHGKKTGKTGQIPLNFSGLQKTLKFKGIRLFHKVLLCKIKVLYLKFSCNSDIFITWYYQV